MGGLLRCKILEPMELGRCKSAPTCRPVSEVRQGLGARGPISRTYREGRGPVLINAEMTLGGLFEGKSSWSLSVTKRNPTSKAMHAQREVE